jgi:hypothetical protein
MESPDTSIIAAFGQLNDPVRLEAQKKAAFRSQKMQREMQSENMLQKVFATPGSIDDKGMVTPNALKQIMARDPQTGFKLQQQNRDAELQSYQLKAEQARVQSLTSANGKARWDYMSGLAGIGVDAYEKALKTGAKPAEAAYVATMARNNAARENGGQLSDQDVQSVVSHPFAVDEAKILAMTNPDYSARLKGERTEAREDARLGLEAKSEAYREASGNREFALQTRRESFEESKPITVGSGSYIYDPKTGGFRDPSDSMSGGGDTFGRMIGAESGGNQFSRSGQPLTSGKGAVGVAQVMPATAKEAAAAAGLAWNEQLYRTDKDYNAKIGRAYFDKLVTRYGGDETKAVAAYNAGPGRVDRAVAQKGEAWASVLPAETKDYLRKVAPGQGGGGNKYSEIARSVANYELPSSQALSRLKPMERERVMEQVRKYNPDFDATTYGERMKAARDFGTGPQGNAVRSLNVGIGHIGVLRQLAAGLSNGNVPAANAAKNWISKNMGHPNVTNFNAARDIVGDEIVKAVIGAGVSGALGDRQAIKKEISAAGSWAQLTGVIDTYERLLAGQLDGLKGQYESSTGRTDFYAREKLSPVTLKALGVDAPMKADAPKIPDDVANYMKMYAGR